MPYVCYGPNKKTKQNKKTHLIQCCEQQHIKMAKRLGSKMIVMKTQCRHFHVNYVSLEKFALAMPTHPCLCPKQ